MRERIKKREEEERVKLFESFVKIKNKEIAEYEKELHTHPDEAELTAISDEIIRLTKDWPNKTVMSEIELEAKKQEWISLTNEKNKRDRELKKKIHRLKEAIKDPECEEFEIFYNINRYKGWW